jgi:hypothetical protein
MLPSTASIDDQQITELTAISRSIIADGVVNKSEFHHLRMWVYQALAVQENAALRSLMNQIEDIEDDDVIEAHELDALFETLRAFTERHKA